MSLQSQAHLLSVGHIRGGNPEPPGGPIPYGEQVYTTPGTYTWIAPEAAAWTNISAVVVAAGTPSNPGPGAGGPGGALVYGNNIPIVYGKAYTIKVGSSSGNWNQNPAQDSYIRDPGYDLSGSEAYIIFATSARHYSQALPHPNPGGDTSPKQTHRSGGGAGGPGGPYTNGWYIDGGGGAGGYSGAGGAGGGGTAHTNLNMGDSLPGTGGGGGGGSGGGAPSDTPLTGGNGGGVGMHGQGPNGSGAGGQPSTATSPGVDGGNGSPGPTGVFGGGAGSNRLNPQPGMNGGVRIVWGGPPASSGGTNRQFPTTNVG